MRRELELARAVRDQMARAMRAAAVELEQTGRKLDEALERMRERASRNEVSRG